MLRRCGGGGQAVRSAAARAAAGRRGTVERGEVEVRRDAVAIVPAGGAASRLGPLAPRGKAAVVVGGRTLLARVCTILAAEVPRVIVVTAPTAVVPDVEARTGTAVEVVSDSTPGAGPLAAIRDGLVRAVTAASPPAIAILCACDAPLVSAGVIRLLLDRAGPGVRWVLPVVGGHPQPLVSVLAVDALPAIERLLAAGAASLRDLAADLAASGPRAIVRVSVDELRRVDPALESFLDVDTPADLARVASRVTASPRRA